MVLFLTRNFYNDTWISIGTKIDWMNSTVLSCTTSYIAEGMLCNSIVMIGIEFIELFDHKGCDELKLPQEFLTKLLGRNTLKVVLPNIKVVSR